MWRGPIAVAACLAATIVQAQTLTLPASAGPFAVATITGGGPAVELHLPPDYDTGGSPLFGFSGDLEDGLALIGSPEAFWDGVAFLFDATTGAETQRLFAGEPLNGGPSRPRFGYDVELWQGLAIVSAPLAGGEFGPGAVFVFNASTGQKLQRINGPSGYSHLGESLEVIGGRVFAQAVTTVGGTVELIDLNLVGVPEPSAMLLVALGLVTAARRR
jgi:hypothetical protein